MNKKIQIGVIGPAGPEEYKYKKPNPGVYKLAEDIGELLAQRNCILLCGGKSGIMKSAARGAKKAGGITVAVVKGNKRKVANNFIDIEIITNAGTGGDTSPFILSCDGVIILGGGAGTLQEMTVAYRNNIPMVALNNIEGYGKIFAGKYIDERKTVKIASASNTKQAVNMLLSKIVK